MQLYGTCYHKMSLKSVWTPYFETQCRWFDTRSWNSYVLGLCVYGLRAFKSGCHCGTGVSYLYLLRKWSILSYYVNFLLKVKKNTAGRKFAVFPNLVSNNFNYLKTSNFVPATFNLFGKGTSDCKLFPFWYSVIVGRIHVCW